MLKKIKKISDDFLQSLKKENSSKNQDHHNSFLYLQEASLPVFGIHETNVFFANQALTSLLEKDNASIESLATDNTFLVISDEIFLKKKLFTLENKDFFYLDLCNLNKDMHYIIFDNKENVVFCSNIISKKKNIVLSDLLSKDSISHLKNTTQYSEIRFLDNPNTTFIISHSRTVENLSCLYLFDITKYKSIEMHLAHSQKMQAIGQLAGGISHDFNNLLTAILGFCDLLLMKHPAGDPSFAEIMQIKQTGNRAANLVRQLLALSRKQVLQSKVIDISEVIAELATLVRRLIGENIDLDIIHGSDLYPVKGDQGQIEQVIINLVVNARDAIFKNSSNKGKISISTKNIKIESHTEIDKSFVCPEKEKISPGEYVLISVTDNGIGIPKSIITEIFEPFFSTKAIGAGTGLGLSTVYSIMKQIGGSLFVSSKENQGTTFNIYLKASYSELEKKEAPLDSLVIKDLTGTATILLVEDENPVRMFCTHALKNKGYTVIEATSGEEALEIFKKEKNNIDLIISDVIMPGITGPSLIEEIKRSNPSIKVIFISGYAEEAFSDHKNLKEGFHFLSKPFTLTQLATLVKDVLCLETTR